MSSQHQRADEQEPTRAMSSDQEMRPRGRMRLEVHGPGGRVVAERRATNIVLRGGAELIAKLVAGTVSKPINQVGVGFATEVADSGATALTGKDGVAPPPPTAIPAGSFTIDATRPGAVAVGVSSTYRPQSELTDVTEAGLLADDDLYNQVVFEPVTLRVGQDVTLFWEIEFPFGH
jgi:hypothetical protein